MTQEADIQALILIYLSSLPHSYVWRQNSGVFHDANGVRRIRACPAGTPDILGVINGYFISVECKRPKKGKVLDSQVNAQRNIEHGKGLYILAKSVDDVVQALQCRGII